MPSFPSFNLPGPLNDAVHDVESNVEGAASTVETNVTSAASTVSAGASSALKSVGDLRAQITAARPDAAFANIASDALAKLPPSMQAMIAQLPNVGTIGGAVGLGKPAVISSPELGESSATPAILDVPVSAQQQGLLAVGKKAHDKFFQNYPPFNFNVNFSCANADTLTRQSDYADPRSPWSNVFFGRYEIDAPAAPAPAAGATPPPTPPGAANQWTRPFGFKAAGSNEIDFDDIKKIGNADWGYFSNWMYGVPEADLDKAFAAQANGPQPTCTVTNPSVMINGKSYVECTVDGVMLPSAYVNPKDGKSLTNNDKIMSPVWRGIFGTQGSDVSDDPTLANTPSFAPTDMKMKFYLRQDQKTDPKTGATYYATEIYGGGVNKTWAGDDPTKQAFNEKFLDAQMDAVKATMPQG